MPTRGVRTIVCAIVLAPLCGAGSLFATDPPAPAPAAPATQPKEKELSAEAKKLLSVLEPFGEQMRKCMALADKAVALGRQALEIQVAMENAEAQTKKRDKDAAASRDKAMTEAREQINTATKCTNGVKDRVNPALEAASASAQVRQEAWAAWVDQLKKAALPSAPAPQP